MTNADSACVKHDISDMKLMHKDFSSQEKLKRNQEEASNTETCLYWITWQELNIMNDTMQQKNAGCHYTSFASMGDSDIFFFSCIYVF